MEFPQIIWHGHASIELISKNGAHIYIDPWEIKPTAPADFIFITHEHHDHYSNADINLILVPETVLVMPKGMAATIKGHTVIGLKPGEKKTFAEISVEAVPAYNMDKKFHPKEKSGLGYIITVDGQRIYQAGDTDYIPEMDNLKDIDVALMPIGGTYTMSAIEAALAVNSFMPKLAIPIHYGKIVGQKKDALEFKAKCKVPVKILE